MTRTIDDVSYAANRRPENRRIYAEQQIDWAYAELLKAQRQRHNCLDIVRFIYWDGRAARAEQDLAEANERHLKTCASLGPADIRVRRRRLSDDHEFVVRDACGFIRWIGNGYWRATEAQDAGRDTAINLGLEVTS